MTRSHALPLLLLLASCSGDLTSDDDDGSITPPVDSHITNVDNGDGSTTSTIDAADEELWIYLDLESGEEKKIDAPASSTEWDIAFRRFRAKTNGGSNGMGGVEVARLGPGNFDGVTDAPSDGYVVDEVDGDDEGIIEDDAIRVGPTSETGPWGYDVETHTLMASGELFVVKSVEGNFYLLEFLEYYDENGSSGKVQMRWKKLADQLGPQELLVSWDRSAAFVSITEGVVAIDDAANSTAWDLQARLVGWGTNGGLDRAGSGGAQLAASTDFDAITTAPTVGYVVDALIPYPGPPGSPDFNGNAVLSDWFEYDMTTHLATPVDAVFLVRGANGDYGKLKILAYDEPNKTYKLKLAPVDRAVEVTSLQVVATDTAAWTYVSLRLGETVEVTDPETDDSWDLAFSGTRVRTNSGTSGDGDGGAQSSASTFEAIASAPADGYVVDTELTSDGAPYSGNAALSEWWAFDSTTSSTVPKDLAYVVRAADGSYAKLRVVEYANDGAYTIDYAYAGPEQTDF